MKRTIVIAAAAVAIVLTTFACTRQPVSENQRPKEELPAEVEGVDRIGNKLRTKPGYELVQQPDGVVALRRPASGGSGEVLLMTCDCDTGSYACKPVLLDDKTVECQNVRDCLSCKWRATKKGDL